MATTYGLGSTIVTASLIQSVTTTGGTILSQGDTATGFEIQFRHDLAGCGGPDSGILILIKDTILWKGITFEWLGNGTAACWTFMNASGNFGDATGTGTGNMLGFDASVDVISRTFLTWEVPEFQSHDRVIACDNDANNFFRFNSGQFKSFVMKRRRNINGQLAGLHHGRSCNSTSSTTIFRNIRIH